MGPLNVNSGHVLNPGTSDIQILLQNLSAPAIYDSSGTAVPIPVALTENVLAHYGFSIVPRVDFSLNMLFTNNRSDGSASSGLGDSMMILGFQVLEQNTHRFQPNFKLTLHQLFPTGRYDQLNPSLFGTDATGIGSYQTSLGLNFDFLTPLSGEHYLKTYINVIGTYSCDTQLSGNSVYGGDIDTLGRMSPGNAILSSLAAEYTLDKNWVAAMDGMFLSQNPSQYQGIVGSDPASFNPLITAYTNSLSPHPSAAISIIKALAQHRIRPTRHNIQGASNIGSGNLTEISLAPALEYNFSDRFGIMFSTWFTVYGKNTPEFFSGLLVMNFLLA